jgi:heme/copper-type cytochrome/quinol oxidase subunit 2
MRNLIRAGSSAVILVMIMFLGSLVLWVGIPLAWLYIGSQVQGAGASLGAALAVMMLGVVVSILALVPFLAFLGRKHSDLREARGLESHGHAALEAVMVISAGIVIVGFSAWFLIFSGSEPLPLRLGGGP